MKRKIKIMIIALFSLASGYSIYNSQKKDITLSDIFLDNVEALAGEAGPTWNHHKRVTKSGGECCEKYWPNYDCSGGLKEC